MSEKGDFVQQALTVVNDEVGRIKKEQEYASEGDAFAHWYLTKRFALVDSEAEDACSVGGPNDKGLDAIWFDDEQKTIFSLQAKYSNSAQAGFDFGDSTKLRASLDFLLDPARLPTVTSELLRERLSEVHDRIRSNYTVQFYVVVLGSISPEARKEIDSIRLQKHTSVQLFTHESNDILNLVPSERERADISADIDVVEGEVFEHRHDTHRSLIVAVTALTLARLRQTYGDHLFDENVRYYLGQKGPNKEMVESLRTPDGRTNYWFYHNGVTAVCRSFHPSEDRRRVHVEGFQIVNGCQTTVTLQEAQQLYEHERETPKLLMRIIQTEGDEPFLRKISKYTNTQAKVVERDLASRDRIQEDLQRSIESAGYFCEIKRGEWNTLPQEKKRKFISPVGQELRVDNIELAKAVMCWEGLPVEAKARKARHFQSEPTGGYYEFIFKPTRTAWEYLLALKILNFSEAKRKALQALYRDQEAQQFEGLDEEERKTLDARSYLIHAETMIAAYISEVTRQKVSAKYFKETVRAFEAGDTSSFEYLFELIDQILTENLKERSKARAFQMSNYFKSTRAWPEIRGALSAQMNLLQKIAGKDPLEGFTSRLSKAGVPAG